MCDNIGEKFKPGDISNEIKNNLGPQKEEGEVCFFVVSSQ